MLAHSKKLFSLLFGVLLFGQASAMTNTLTSPQALQDRLQQTKIQQVVLNIINPACVRSFAGDLALGHNRDGFHVLQNNKLYKVDSFDVDRTIRNLNPRDLARFCENGMAISVNRIGHDYMLRLAPCLKGGGPVGATVGVFVGKAVVSVVGHGTIALIATGAGALSACPGVGWTVEATLESWFGAAIEAASIKGALIGGIIGGVAPSV